MKTRYLYAAIAVILSIIIVLFIKNYVLKYQTTDINHRLQWWLTDIGWDTGRINLTGQGITVAIIDSGVESSHPDLENCIVEEYRVSGIKENSEDDKSYGTAVAGVIAAYPAEEKGVLGIATDVKILSVDVTDDVDGKVEIVNLVEGIRYAVKQNVDIINISVGVKEETEELHNAVKEAYEAGIVMVASAGNYMEGDLLYPAKYSEVIAVGSKAKDGEIISPSGELEKTVIYLPGENVVTTNAGESGYTGASGTSIATPILTGIIALMLENNNGLTNDDIISYFDGISSLDIKVQNCIDLVC